MKNHLYITLVFETSPRDLIKHSIDKVYNGVKTKASNSYTYNNNIKRMRSIGVELGTMKIAQEISKVEN